jgi:uncharacterized protein
MHLNTAIRPLTLLLLSLLTSALSAEAVVAGTVVGTPPKCLPALEGWVNDAADVLSSKERRELSEILSAYHDETHHQLVVLTIPSLSDEPLETYSLRVLSCWGLGYKGIDNGILVLLAVNDRKSRIELGTGMSHYISDATAKSIMDSAMIPEFAKRNYASGIRRGLERLMQEARRFVVKPSELLTEQETHPSHE